jgi:hypothetical protein
MTGDESAVSGGEERRGEESRSAWKLNVFNLKHLESKKAGFEIFIL